MKPRESVELLSRTTVRSDEFIKVCSWCKKVAISDTKWVEIERAIEILNLYAVPKLPQPTHGICPVCYESWIVDLKKHHS